MERLFKQNPENSTWGIYIHLTQMCVSVWLPVNSVVVIIFGEQMLGGEHFFPSKDRDRGRWVVAHHSKGQNFNQLTMKKGDAYHEKTC